MRKKVGWSEYEKKVGWSEHEKKVGWSEQWAWEITFYNWLVRFALLSSLSKNAILYSN